MLLLCSCLIVKFWTETQPCIRFLVLLGSSGMMVLFRTYLIRMISFLFFLFTSGAIIENIFDIIERVIVERSRIF